MVGSLYDDKIGHTLPDCGIKYTVLTLPGRARGGDMLYIFGGLPGTGKSTLASGLARRRGAVYLRADTIEQALRDGGVEEIGPKGYVVGYALATENLRLGREVVADSVNPLAITRRAWRAAADRAGRPCVEIEMVCSDRAEHRRRVERRAPDVPGLRPPSWAQVAARAYEPWPSADIVVDTAGVSAETALATLCRDLAL